MKTLTKKSEITAKNLKAQDCIYKGRRLGFSKIENLYFIGSLFHPTQTFYSSISDVKDIFPAV